MVASSLPFIYDAVKSQSWKKFKPFFIASLGGITGFLLAIVIHGAILYGESYNPIEILSQIIQKRTHAYLGLENVPAVLHDSLTGNVFHTLQLYLFDENRLGIYTLNLFLIAICLGLIGGIKNEKSRAFFVIVAVAILGTLSWHVLAKGHSNRHTSINYVLWYVPTSYLIYMFYIHTLEVFRENFNKWEHGKKCKIFLISALVFSIVFSLVHYTSYYPYTLLHTSLVLLIVIQLWEIYRSSLKC